MTSNNWFAWFAHTDEDRYFAGRKGSIDKYSANFPLILANRNVDIVGPFQTYILGPISQDF
jgi:hypothetical protein